MWHLSEPQRGLLNMALKVYTGRKRQFQNFVPFLSSPHSPTTSFLLCECVYVLFLKIHWIQFVLFICSCVKPHLQVIGEHTESYTYKENWFALLKKKLIVNKPSAKSSKNSLTPFFHSVMVTELILYRLCAGHHRVWNCQSWTEKKDTISVLSFLDFILYNSAHPPLPVKFIVPWRGSKCDRDVQNLWFRT